MASEGRIEGIDEGCLVGWAHDPDQPGVRLELELALDGEQLGVCVADVERGDLRDHGIGDGLHGFRFELPWPLAPGSEHEVMARVTADDTILGLSSDLDNPIGEDAIRLFAVGRLPQPEDVTDHASESDLLSLLDAAQRLGPPPLPLPAPEGGPQVPRALLGIDGWLFPYSGAAGLARVLGHRPVTAARVEEQAGMVMRREQHSRELDTGYLLAILPAKASVHWEQLPPGLSLDPDGRPADQLVSALRAHPELDVLDLFAPLRHARAHGGEVYLRQGLRLTWAGAFRAYHAIAKELSKRFTEITPPPPRPLQLSEPVEVTDPLRARERVTLLGGRLVPVAIIDDVPDRDREVRRETFDAMYVPLDPELGASDKAALLRRDDRPDLPRAVIVHDGSAGRLVPFLAEHFSRTLVEVGEHPPWELIERERPLVVIQVVSEHGSLLT